MDWETVAEWAAGNSVVPFVNHHGRELWRDRGYGEFLCDRIWAPGITVTLQTGSRETKMQSDLKKVASIKRAIREAKSQKEIKEALCSLTPDQLLLIGFK